MPSDMQPGADEVGAPELPRLCPDHIPVIGNAKHLDDLSHIDSANARFERARQCRDCYQLNDRRLTS